MLLTAARFPTRVDEHGALLRPHNEDRGRWNQTRIGRGRLHLAVAAQGDDVSDDHPQAGIAALPCTAENYAATDWPRILRHSDALLRLKPSPIVTLNRAVAHLGPAQDHISCLLGQMGTARD